MAKNKRVKPSKEMSKNEKQKLLVLACTAAIAVVFFLFLGS
jgi:hypothetical protein